jgi:PHD/YefM family antitoxin component YafN of YafNO toxin-antitoxin module
MSESIAEAKLRSHVDDREDEVVAVGSEPPLHELIERVASTGAPILVAREGDPRAAIVTLADLADLRRLRIVESRRAALAELERLHAELGESNQGVSEEEAEEFGRRMGKEINRAVARAHQRLTADRRRTA